MNRIQPNPPCAAQIESAREIIDYPSLTTAPAWIGYDRAAVGRGELIINICTECEGTDIAEAQARRLKCKTVRTLCPTHIAARTARICGDRT